MNANQEKDEIADEPLQNVEQQLEPETEHSIEPAWYDEMHGSISESVVVAADWFDDFFVEDLSRNRQAKALTRFRFGWEPRAGDLGDNSFKFRMKLKLPDLEDKFDLILANVSDDEDELLPLEGEKVDSSDSNKFGVAIRVVHQDNSKRFFDTRIGIGSGTVFVRTRSRRKFLISDRWMIRGEPSITYFADDGWQVKGLIESEYQLESKNLWRVSTSAWVEEGEGGYQWKHGLSHLHQVNDHTALISGVVVSGESHRGYRADDVRVSARWRQQMHRSWLYIEVEPFVDFERDRNFKDEFGVALRIEGLFGRY